MDDQASVGQTLRRRREERGLTIEQAAFQSKVPLRLVQALESDDYHLLPDALYLIRLLHEYARCLSLDPASLEAEFRSAIRRPSRTSLAPFAPIQTSLEIPWKHVVWTLVAILVVTPLVFIALSLASKRAAERAVRPPTLVQPAAEPARPEVEEIPAAAPVQPGGVPTGEGTAAGEPRGGAPTAPTAGRPPGTLPPAEGTPPEPSPRRYLLVARAEETTWMVVQADGGESREVLLQPGQAARFAADTGFVVTVGNAGGVALSLNGAPLPTLGKSGEVIRDLVLPQAPGAALPPSKP